MGSDPILDRIQNLEALVFGTIPRTSVQNINTPGAITVTPQNGLVVLITASEPVVVTLPEPTVAQSNFIISFLNANGQQNSVSTVANGLQSYGTPTSLGDLLSDSGGVGNLCSVFASGGLWIFGRGGGVGWSGNFATT